jgi:predicted component of type VI protein secretion system
MATLVYSDADGVDRSFALGSEPVMVGRGPECGIRSQDKRVSRMHARYFVEQGSLWVEDLGSANGIFVGPNKVQRAPVPIGEIILVGSLMIRLLPASTLPPMGLHGARDVMISSARPARPSRTSAMRSRSAVASASGLAAASSVTRSGQVVHSAGLDRS